MNNKIKRFNINGNIIKYGYMNSFLFNDGNILLNNGTGLFFTNSLDSAQQGMKWGRLVLDADMSEDSNFYIYVMASDEIDFKYQNQLISYNEFFMSHEISNEDKICVMKNNTNTKIFHNFKDVLLFGLEGRYLWIGMEVKYASKLSIKNMLVYFPGDSLLKYFPEIYKKNKDDFFERYLAIFSSLNKDYQKEVDGACSLLDVDKTTDDMLMLLADWLGMDIDGHFLTNEQLRMLIKNAKYLNQYKGTIGVINKVVEIFIGVKPFIDEQIKVQRYICSENYALYKELYGGSQYEFLIILNYNLKKEVFYQLKSLINIFKPARTKAVIMFLKQKCQLDKHCYVDINARIARSVAGTLDKEQCLDSNVMLVD